MNVAQSRKTRIDQMLKDGKITPEQHEELLGSLEEENAEPEVSPEPEADAFQEEPSPAPEEKPVDQAQSKKGFDLAPGPFFIGGAIWAVVVFVGLGFTHLFVLPRFESIYASMGAELPGLTELLISVQRRVVLFWFLSVPLFIVLLLGFWAVDCLRNAYRKWKGWRYILTAFFTFLGLSIPVIVVCIILALYLPMLKIGDVIK